MALVKVQKIRTSAGIPTQGVQNLFPDALGMKTGNGLVEYIKSRLMEFVRDKTLYLTWIFAQEERSRNIAGMVILGKAFVEDKNPFEIEVNPYLHTPDELRVYPIKLRSLNGDTIKWSGGKVPVDRKEWTRGINGSGAIGNVTLTEPVVIDSAVTEGEFAAPDAWNALRLCGKWCKRANGPEAQNALWRIEEVPPPGLDLGAGRILKKAK